VLHFGAVENPWREDHRAGDPDATRLMLEWDREHRTGTYEGENRGGDNNLAVVVAVIALALAVFALLQ
jgi:hypothetical protein